MNLKNKSNNAENHDISKDLLKLRKKEILKIMLEQGLEIDRLKARIKELEDKLDRREANLEELGSLAEASVYMSDLFKEADRVVTTYVKNVKRKYG